MHALTGFNLTTAVAVKLSRAEVWANSLHTQFRTIAQQQLTELRLTSQYQHSAKRYAAGLQQAQQIKTTNLAAH
jgi:hypothetical protein